jgi:hypothetical protein
MEGLLAILGSITFIFLVLIIVLCVNLSRNYRKLCNAGVFEYRGKAWKYILKVWGILFLCLIGGSLMSVLVGDNPIVVYVVVWISAFIIIMNLRSQIRDAKVFFEYHNNKLSNPSPNNNNNFSQEETGRNEMNCSRCGITAEGFDKKYKELAAKGTVIISKDRNLTCKNCNTSTCTVCLAKSYDRGSHFECPKCREPL